MHREKLIRIPLGILSVTYPLFLFIISFYNWWPTPTPTLYILEYVEQFCFPDIKGNDLPTNFTTFSRQEKWEAFLRSSSGSPVLQCFLLKNPLWKDAKTSAKHISSIYQFSSNFSHSTSHEIAANPSLSIILDKLSTNVQTYAAMSCLAQQFSLSLVSPDRIKDKNEIDRTW